MQIPLPEIPSSPVLLVTRTNEPFQPVRLYYRIPSRGFVGQRLSTLRCMSRDLRGKGWRWLYCDEAAGLTFFLGHGDVPQEFQPIILGRFRFPRGGGMTLELNSFPRAIEAAKFFGPIFGEKLVLHRARVVNRCFAAADGSPEEFMNELDRNVTVVTMTLRLRLIRAIEHWRGNTHLTLTAIIMRMVEPPAVGQPAS